MPNFRNFVYIYLLSYDNDYIVQLKSFTLQYWQLPASKIGNLFHAQFLWDFVRKKWKLLQLSIMWYDSIYNDGRNDDELNGKRAEKVETSLIEYFIFNPVSHFQKQYRNPNYFKNDNVSGLIILWGEMPCAASRLSRDVWLMEIEELFEFTWQNYIDWSDFVRGNGIPFVWTQKVGPFLNCHWADFGVRSVETCQGSFAFIC